MSAEARPRRARLPSAIDGPLLFGAVREDPRLEIEALRPAFGGRLAVVGSGGCTALSLLASGAREVVAVDVNATQNHLVDLKHAAVRSLGPDRGVAFLGLDEAPAAERREWYARLCPELTADAARYWDAHRALVERGVHRAGRSERMIRVVAGLLRAFVHPPTRIHRLLACSSLEEQRELFSREWNNRRFRLLYRLLLNRTTLSRALDPAVFARVPNGRLDRHFLQLFEHGITALRVADNYFLHEMLTGRYPTSTRPPYLTAEGAARLAAERGCLRFVDGAFTDFLRTQPSRSLDGLALSNVCEWLDAAAIEALFAEVVRTLRPGAVVVFRNFVGSTEVPERFRNEVVEDRARGEALISGDRSLLQRRIAVCRVEHLSHLRSPGGALRVRAAEASDNEALLRLAARCPMEGELTLCVERAPDFFALSGLEGRRGCVLVAETPRRVVGCIALSERASYLHGQSARTLYVGDLKVDPGGRGRGVADALTKGVCDLARDWGEAETPILVTVLRGNRSMERRLDGPRGLPPLTRFATIRSLSLPALRRPGARGRWRVRPAGPEDVAEMLALWQSVALERQLAPVYAGPEEFVRWVESAPGLGLSAYRLAHDPDGRLRGFLAIWEQSRIKQLRVVADSPRLARARVVLERLGPLLGLPPLSRPGEILSCATVFGLCVSSDRPRVLRALLRHALAELRSTGVSFLNLGLDERDPLLTATRGLFGQPTLVHAYAVTASGRWEGGPLDGRPLHFETALV